MALSSEAGTHQSEFIGMAFLPDQDSGVRRQLQKGKKKDGVSPVFFTNSCRLHTSGRLGKTSHFAGSLARSGGEEFVNFLQFVAGILGKNTNHGGNAVLFVVILQEVKNLLMVGSELLDDFGLFDVLQPFRAPFFKVKKESILVHFKGFAFELYFSHVCPPWTS